MEENKKASHTFMVILQKCIYIYGSFDNTFKITKIVFYESTFETNT